MKKNKYKNIDMFLGKKADDLSHLISKQSKSIFDKIGIIIPVKSTSLVICLDNKQKLSVVEIANELGQSRQLIIQKIPKLEQLGLIKPETVADDKRRKLYVLTDTGQEQVKKILKIQNDITMIYENLFDEINVNLFDAIDKTIKALNSKNLDQRLKN